MYNTEKVVKKQKRFFQTNKTKSIEFRQRALQRLKIEIKQQEEAIKHALKTDLNKSGMEAYMTEIGMILSEITFVQKHLKQWAKDKKVPTPLVQFYAKSFIQSEPYGVTLIMAPWNYPFMLSIGPLIGAIAAGNCAVIKPSELAPATAHVIKEMIGECFPEHYITVVEGEKEVSSALLDQEFDYIFFTGGVKIGKIVMEKAAKNLTPVTLELGGKSPCIVDRTANCKQAAKRIVFGKFINSGQTCVAPDYVFVHEEVKEQFYKYLTYYTKKMYGVNPLNNEKYTKIINQHHFERLLHMLEGEDILIGGKADVKTLKMEPTILRDVSVDARVMQEEIFGPILPVIVFEQLKEVETYIKNHPKPLACYLFTDCKKVEKRLLQSLSFGGGCINDTIMHLSTPYMPFGGVGTSGMGSYHGKKSFETFSHEKSIMKKYNIVDFPIRYQPYTKWKEIMVAYFLK